MGNTKSKDVDFLKDLSEKALNSDFVLPLVHVKKLIGALNSGRPVRSQWAANVISYLCRDNAENRELLGTKSMKCLSSNLKSRNIKLQTWSICAIGNLCIDNKFNQNKFIEEDGIPRTINLLLSNDHQLQRWSCNAIGIICMNNSRNQDLFVKLGGVGPLVSCLNSPDPDVQRWAVFAIGNIAQSKEYGVLIVREGAMRPLVQIINKCENDREAQRWSSNVIAMLCADEQIHRNKLREMNGIKPLISLLSCEDNKVARNAAFALGNACLENPENQREVVEGGALEILVDLVKTTNKKGEQLRYYAAMVLVIVGKHRDDLPSELKTVFNEDKTKTMIGRKVIDMIDQSNTVAMRISKKMPNLQELFTDESPLVSRRSSETENENGSSTLITSDNSSSFKKEKKEKRITVTEAIDLWSIKYEDLNIDFDELIGIGAFGNVFKGRYFGTEVAVKELLNADVDEIQKLIIREVETLKNIRHPNVVQWMGCCIHESGLFIITEYVNGGDLRKLLKNNELPLPWSIRLKIALDICYSLCFLHSKQTMHRDLKSKNVLLEEGSFKAKVCDFGFSREYNSDKKNNLVTFRVGTDTWMAPEVLMGNEYDFSADVWSYGILLFELITRTKPPKRNITNSFNFNDKEFSEKIQESTQNDIENIIVVGLTDLAIKCTQTSPSDRPTFSVILKQLEAIPK